MPNNSTFIELLEAKVFEQLGAQRVAYLLGAGSSFLNGLGYPLAFQLWDEIKSNITDLSERDAIQAKLDGGADGIEHALDLLDDGGATDTHYRHTVTKAVAELFISKHAPLDIHCQFVKRLALKGVTGLRIFSLNYDPLIELSASKSKIRLVDGFHGAEDSFFQPSVFEERIFTVRGTYKGKTYDEIVKPLQLLKLHGSLGWYECQTNGLRRCAYVANPPTDSRRLMIPPQRRKASDTMNPPYSALWSLFRGSLVQDANPINRLVCLGYGFSDEHVNTLIESALIRKDFTLLIFAKALTDVAWDRWSSKSNVVIVTEKRSSLKGVVGVGHPNLWDFERLASEV